jgi:hypothetical protein
MSIAFGMIVAIFMKQSQSRIKQDVPVDSINRRRTLRKAVAGLLKQSVANGLTPKTQTTESILKIKKETL